MEHAHVVIFKDVKDEKFQWNVFDVFLIFAQNIDYGYTFEPPRRDIDYGYTFEPPRRGGSNEYP